MMKNDIFSLLEFYPDWFHQPLAYCLAVTGIYIDMLAPKAFRTVVGIAASMYKGTAIFTNEIFFGALEFFQRHSFSKY